MCVGRGTVLLGLYLLRCRRVLLNINLTKLRLQASALKPRVCKRVDTHRRPCHVLSTLCVFLKTNTILVLHTFRKVGIQLSILSEGHHQLRKTQGEGIATVVLPEVKHLPVCFRNLLELLVFSCLRHSWHEENTSFHLILMSMPKLLFLIGQILE